MHIDMLQKLHAFYFIICLGMVWTKMHPILKCVTLKTKTSNIIWLVTQFYEAFIELKMLSIQDHQKQYSHIFANTRKNYFSFAILAICVKTTFFVANQQIRGGERIKGIFCIRRKPTNFCHSGSLLLTLTHSISGSLCHCHSRSIWLNPGHSGSLRHLLAHKVLARFARSLYNPAIWLDFFLTNASYQYDYAKV